MAVACCLSEGGGNGGEGGSPVPDTYFSLSIGFARPRPNLGVIRKKIQREFFMWIANISRAGRG